MPSLDTRIVARHTLMKGINMSETNIREFAALDNRAEPDFIENKGYVYVGHSRENLSAENMPSHDDIVVSQRKLLRLLEERFCLIQNQVVLLWLVTK